MTITLENWATIAQAKQQRNLDSIPAEWRINPVESVHVMDIPATCGILTPDELNITGIPVQDLVAQTRKGVLKSYDVVLAFVKRAAIAHQLVSLHQGRVLINRPTASRRSTFKVPLPKLLSLMLPLPSLDLSEHCMDYRCRSRTTSMSRD